MDILWRVAIFLLIMAFVWILIIVIDRFYDLEAHGISLGPGTLTWRTQQGLSLLDKISEASESGWKIFGIFAAVGGIILMILMFVFFALGTILGFFAMWISGGSHAIPAGAETKVVAIPGVTIPLLVGIIGLATVLLVHEPAHGIILRHLNLKTKSTGLLLFLIIPGAFVEEDEKEFKKASVWERIQVASAGPMANVLFGVLCLGLVLVLVNPLQGVFISGIVENKAAEEAGVRPGVYITGIGNDQVVNYGDLEEFMNESHPGDSVTLTVTGERRMEENQYLITLDNHPSENEGYLGVFLIPSLPKSSFLQPQILFFTALEEILGYPTIDQHAYSTPVPWFLIKVLKWMFALNLLIALFNLLPLKPLDGGHIIEGIAERTTSKSRAEEIANTVGFMTLSLIMLSIALIFMG
ncbi:hypothetical protein AKJ63_00610 [candidate division MSBL1 archaeon SCGC-AAA259D18]|uniref:PDZ domain-containing protein n=2 Tax=candidate division MSBL1 TaxID=215777 RepID=A0A133U9V2_9EURY|nr:hypothetical protein AKJ57_03145 [candidate division MSBL1 archaeon SCGC-AAA259A05]KXA91870.1 hypothetical protein AKJ63_00610 [candidate division MSBL1 archaeon SCGC-AAA259D18]